MECQEFILRQISIRFVGVYCYITRLWIYETDLNFGESIFEVSTIYNNYCVGDMITGRVGVFYRSMLFNNNNRNHIIIIRGFQRFLSVFNCNKNFKKCFFLDFIYVIQTRTYLIYIYLLIRFIYINMYKSFINF